VETSKEIHDRMLTNVSDEYEKTIGSFIYDATMPGAVIFAETQAEIEAVESKMDVYNLTSSELTKFVYQRTGIMRKAATIASTTVLITGDVGSTINIGDLVGTDTLNFIVLETKTIEETGSMLVLVGSELPGVVGNVPTNTINQFPVSIDGLNTVTNPTAVDNGYREETDWELIQRYFDKLQRPGKAGNIYHYLEWARSVIGVGDAKVIPQWNGLLTVKVVVIDSNKQPASAGLITEAFNYIEGERPFGADVTVVSAAPLLINLTFTLTLEGGYVEATVIESIKENISLYLQEIAFKSSVVSYAKTGGILIETEGVLDYENLLVNGATANIPIGVEEVAIMGGVNE
jgi:uncharacterized phage protein gp47/JayE